MGVSVLGMYDDVTLTNNTSSYTLLDTNPFVPDLKCPQVALEVGSSQYASVQPGAQQSVTHEAACARPA